MSGNTPADSAVVVILLLALIFSCAVAYWADRGQP